MSDSGIIKSHFKCGETPYTVEWGIEADKRMAELEEGNRLAVAEAYRCGFEAGKVESDLWGEAATTIKELNAELAALKQRIHDACEVYAGMEGFKPETAPEGYCLRIIEQMYRALQEKGE